ncbi:MAG: hypothetical protein J5715_08845 [Clostridiales bacterium]|nr:hypothetical protein [Clostridiales bacterium]
MKRILITAATAFLGITMLAGCGSQPAPAEPFEPQRKEEVEGSFFTEGMIQWEKNSTVTLVQKEKDGEWIKEDTKVAEWKISPDCILDDTVWIIESDDASSLYSKLGSSFKNKKATVRMLFGKVGEIKDSTVGQKEDGTPRLEFNSNATCDLIFECEGNKLLFEGAKFNGGYVYEDGTAELKIDYGQGEGLLSVPSNIRKGDMDNFKNFLPSETDKIKQASDNYISLVPFDNLPTFKATSSNVKDGVWDDKITNTKHGENISPELSWEAVEGASQYVVIMIDAQWLHMDVFTTETSIAEGAIGRGEKGAQYVGPYPPSGTHTYSVFIFALKDDFEKANLYFDSGLNSLEKIFKGLDSDKNGNTGNVIAYARLDGNYTHKD